MKIVYFNYLYDRYGISLGSTRKAEQLMKALSQCGHDIRICWMKPDPVISSQAYVKVKSRLKKGLSGYLHDPKQLASNFYYLVKEWRILNLEKPDLVISRLDNYLFSSLMLCKLKKIPLIIEADAPGRYEIQKFCPEFKHMAHVARWIENINMNHADLSICVSDIMRSYFIEEGACPEKIVTVSNGADVDQFNPARRNSDLRAKHGIDDKIVIGFIGSFQAWHGIRNMVSAIEHVLLKYSNAAFLLIGQAGAVQAELKHLFTEQKYASRMILLDYVDYDQMPEYVASMDICLALYPPLPFFYFSPVKVYEYMASGRAVVASRIGQIIDIIQDGKNGVLYDPDRLEDMVRAIEQLIENPEKRSRLGDQARKTIMEEHRWMRKAEVWSEYCKNILQKYIQ